MCLSLEEKNSLFGSAERLSHIGVTKILHDMELKLLALFVLIFITLFDLHDMTYNLEI